MGAPITFMCDGCQATLTVPAELAGISGPCPYCAKVITSPAHAPVAWPPAVAVPMPAPARIAPLAAPVAAPPRPWLNAQLMAPAESPSRGKVRRMHPALWAAAGVTIFAGGVAALWQLWSPPADEARSQAEAAPAEKLPVRAVVQRPEVLASADDPPPPEEAAALPPPSDTKPAAMAPATVVARNVSTSPAAAAAPLESSPEPASAVLFSPESEAMRAIRKVVPMGGPLAKPGEAIIHFLAASTWQERLAFTLAPERMKPLMAAYYRAGGDGPIIPEEVELTRLEPTENNPKFHYYSFIVYMPGRPAGIPLSVEDTASGPLVEWRTFVECKDHLLANYYKSYTPGPTTFRAFIRRCHYFEKDIPGQDKKQCFELSSPDATGTFYLWADTDSPAYRKHFATGERTRWDVSSMMTLTLEWQKSESGVAWVRLRDVVAESWHPELLPAGAAK